jgi:hypothetical protein
MTTISEIKDPVERLFAFAQARYDIYRLREAKTKPPWTSDPILQNYRFTNVYREDDNVTCWIREHWREPNHDDPDLWFAMAVARLLNRPVSLEAVGYPVPWKTHKGTHSYDVRFAQILNRRKKAGEKIFNAAYIVSTNGIMMDKLAYLKNEVLDPLWSARQRLRPKEGDSLNSYHMLLGQMQGFGSFMTGQVIADLKYHKPLIAAGDWHTFACSGPGSRRGLNYVLGRDRKSPWEESDWRMELDRLRKVLLPLFKRAQMPQPHGQDVQNLLCEWSKYWRAATEGKMPKQRYQQLWSTAPNVKLK